MSDIKIAQQAKMQNITEIATQKLGLQVDDLDSYGRYKAKVSLQVMDDLATKPDGKLILVTAISPTPAGEGKTTTTIGLSDALNRIGKSHCLCSRTLNGSMFWFKGWSCRGRLFAGGSNGRHQSALYW